MSSRRGRKIDAPTPRAAILTRSLRSAASALVVLTLAAGAFGAPVAGASPGRAKMPSHLSGCVSAGSHARETNPLAPNLPRAPRVKAAPQRAPIIEQPTHPQGLIDNGEHATAVAPVSAESDSATRASLRYRSKASRTRGSPVRR